MKYPPCFGSQESWDIWLKKAKESGLEDPEKNYCVDCTPSYQELAKRYQVCDKPDTFFIVVYSDDDEVEIVGISPDDYMLEW